MKRLSQPLRQLSPTTCRCLCVRTFLCLRKYGYEFAELLKYLGFETKTLILHFKFSRLGHVHISNQHRSPDNKKAHSDRDNWRRTAWKDDCTGSQTYVFRDHHIGSE